MRLPSETTDQVIYFVAVDATDLKTRETGLSSFTVYRGRNGAAAAPFTTPTVTEVDATNMPGVYSLLLDEDMTIAAGNDSEEMVFHITHAGMAPVTRVIELYRRAVTGGRTLGVEADGDLTKVNTLDGHTAQTGDAYAVVNNGTYGNSALQTILASTGVPLTSGERTTLAAAIEAAIINELDGEAVMQAIADLIANDMTTGDLSVQAIASAVRDAILNRVLAGNHDTTGTPGKLIQNLDAAVSSRAEAAALTSIGNMVASIITYAGRIEGYIDTEVADIKAKTDLIPASPAAVGSAMTLAAEAISAATLTADAVAAIQAGLAPAAALLEVATEIAKIPRSGQTYRWTNAESLASVDLTVGEAD